MEALIKGAEIYFNDKQGLQIIYASPDGQYFYESGDCLAYMANNKITGEPIEIKAPKTDEPKSNKPKKKVENGSAKKSNSK